MISRSLNIFLFRKSKETSSEDSHKSNLFEIKSLNANYELIWSWLFSSSVLNKNGTIKRSFSNKIFTKQKKKETDTDSFSIIII